MRYFTFVSLIGIASLLMLSSEITWAQDRFLEQPLTLETTHPTVRQLLEQLRVQRIRLVYSESYLNLQQRVRFVHQDLTVKEALDAIGRATNTTYQIQGDQVIFRRKETKFTVSGYVRAATSGEDLIGASVWQDRPTKSLDQDKMISGTSSNTYGFYSLTLPTDTVRLCCSYVGYTSQEETFILRQDTVVNWNLDDKMLAEVMVVSPAVRPLEQTSLNLPVAPADLLVTPTLLGEVDLLKSLQRLPGVQSGVDGGASLYVRGSGPDQNLLLLDGVPLYNTSHLLGLVSMFNTDAINNINFYKGGFPARYGGRLASVVDVQLKEGNREQFGGAGAVGLLSSRLMLEGPLFSNKTSFLLSGRYANLGLYSWALSQLGALDDAIYSFYDITAKINHTLSHRNQLYVSTYRGQDRFRSSDDLPNLPLAGEGGSYWASAVTDEDLRGGNVVTALRWNHVYHRQLFSNLTLTHSRYRFQLDRTEEGTLSSNGVYSTTTTDRARVSDTQDWSARLDYDYRPNPRHHFRLGGGITHRRFRPALVGLAYRRNEKAVADTSYDASEVNGLEAELFVEDELVLSPTLTVNGGARYTAFWVDRTFYSVGQPRLSLQYRPTTSTVWDVSYARMGQFVHLLTNPTVGLPNDPWLPTTRRLPPQTAQQWTLAYRKKLTAPYELQAEAYYKDQRNIVEYKEGSFAFDEEVLDWEERLARGRGRSYGLELLAQRSSGRLTGWLGYAWSRSERQFDDLNGGRWFPFRYDRRHEVDFGGVFHWKDHIDVSWGWGLSSGLAVTLPEQVFAERVPVAGFEGGIPVIYGEPLLIYGSRNGYRTRAIHRLDVSISFRKTTRWGERSWEFGVYNLYSRRNPFYLATENYSYPAYQVRVYQVSLFPMVPTVSYRFKF